MSRQLFIDEVHHFSIIAVWLQKEVLNKKGSLIKIYEMSCISIYFDK